MTQVTKKNPDPQARPTKTPASPKQAARRRAPLDKRLDTELFKALGDPTRVKILACLVKCSRPCTTTEVAACCSVDFSVVARHLSVLARAGVLESEKRGRTMWYAPKTTKLAETFRALADAIEEWNTQDCCGGSCGCDSAGSEA